MQTFLDIFGGSWFVVTVSISWFLQEETRDPEQIQQDLKKQDQSGMDIYYIWTKDLNNDGSRAGKFMI